MRKNPRYYDSKRLTSHELSSLLPAVLKKLSKRYSERPDLVLGAWPNLVGPQISEMTEAVSFIEGELIIKVRTSSLYALLSQYERPKLLKNLRERFPQTSINRLTFRHG